MFEHASTGTRARAQVAGPPVDSLDPASAWRHALRLAAGLETYVAGDKGRTDRSERIGRHLILLAKNEEGWANLRMLSSKAFTEGFYYDPRIDKQLLRQHSKGLVGLTACSQNSGIGKPEGKTAKGGGRIVLDRQQSAEPGFTPNEASVAARYSSVSCPPRVPTPRPSSRSLARKRVCARIRSVAAAPRRDASRRRLQAAAELGEVEAAPQGALVVGGHEEAVNVLQDQRKRVLAKIALARFANGA